MRGVTLEEDLGFVCEAVARGTGGFTGAELANVVNEGVLLAARQDRDVVTVEVGTGEQCSPRHSIPFNSRNEGSKCV